MKKLQIISRNYKNLMRSCLTLKRENVMISMEMMVRMEMCSPQMTGSLHMSITDLCIQKLPRKMSKTSDKDTDTPRMRKRIYWTTMLIMMEMLQIFLNILFAVKTKIFRDLSAFFSKKLRRMFLKIQKSSKKPKRMSSYYQMRKKKLNRRNQK